MFLSGQANAALITYSGTQLITESGQSFNWTESVLSATGAGLLVVEAAGDFDSDGSKFSSISLDDMFSAFGLGIASADYTLADTSDGQYWVKSLIVPLPAMSLITSDNLLNVSIQNADQVNPIWDSGFVSWSLTYDGIVSAVPLPATLWMFIAGLVVLVGCARCRNSA